MRLIPCTGERFMVAGGGRFLLSQVQDAAQLLREGYAQQVQLIIWTRPLAQVPAFMPRSLADRLRYRRPPIRIAWSRRHIFP